MDDVGVLPSRLAYSVLRFCDVHGDWAADVWVWKLPVSSRRRKGVWGGNEQIAKVEDVLPQTMNREGIMKCEKMFSGGG